MALALGVSLLVKNAENQPILMQAVTYISSQKLQINEDTSWEDVILDAKDKENDDGEVVASWKEEGDEVVVKKAAEGYTTYNESLVKDALTSGKKVALFFHASRCPSCVALNGNIETNIAQIPADTMIYKVDYDNSNDMKETYGVTSQHTLVYIDESMNEVKKVVWPTNLDEVLEGFTK